MKSGSVSGDSIFGSGRTLAMLSEPGGQTTLPQISSSQRLGIVSMYPHLPSGWLPYTLPNLSSSTGIS